LHPNVCKVTVVAHTKNPLSTSHLTCLEEIFDFTKANDHLLSVISMLIGSYI